MILAMTVTAFADSENTGGTISIAENSNAEFTAQMNGEALTRSSAVPQSSVSITIDSRSEDQISGTVGFSYNGDAYQVSATGEIADYNGGSIGVLQGTQWIDGQSQLVTADFVNAANGDAFVIINIGYITDEEKVPFLVYGEYTNTIGSMYAQESAAKSAAAEAAVEEYATAQLDSLSPVPNAVDGEYRYQGSSPISSNGLSFGSISIFYPNELRNQGVATIFAKVNSDNSAVVDYIKDNYNVALNTAIALPDKFNIRVAAQHGQVSCVTGSYYPEPEKTTQTIDIPYLDPTSMSIGFFPITLTLSETTVTRSVYMNSPLPNIVDWEMYKSGGFYNTDGDAESDDSGIAAYADFKAATSSANEIDFSVNCRGSIRYWCQYLPNASATQMVSFHLTTGTTSKTTTMTLVPD